MMAKSILDLLINFYYKKKSSLLFKAVKNENLVPCPKAAHDLKWMGKLGHFRAPWPLTIM